MYFYQSMNILAVFLRGVDSFFVGLSKKSTYCSIKVLWECIFTKANIMGMVLTKSQDIFQLKPGDAVAKKNLFDLIQYSKVEGSEYWAGLDFRIGNTPQQGINWIGELPEVKAVIIKTKPGAYEEDAWLDEERLTYRYSFKLKRGSFHMRIQQTACCLCSRTFITRYS